VAGDHHPLPGRRQRPRRSGDVIRADPDRLVWDHQADCKERTASSSADHVFVEDEYSIAELNKADGSWLKNLPVNDFSMQGTLASDGTHIWATSSAAGTSITEPPGS
jgi:hypothetical protein